MVSTAAWPPPNVNVADRDYFQDARTRTDGKLSTSVPINNRIDGTRTIVFARRLDDGVLLILDVRTEEEFRGKHGYPCDPRQGRIPGARHLPVQQLFAEPGEPLPADQIRALLGDPEEIVAYCHSGSRSSLATLALRSAGFRARNYAGSWHEWSRHEELPLEKG